MEIEAMQSIVSYYNGLPEHFKWEGVLMILNPYNHSINNLIDDLTIWKKSSTAIDLFTGNQYEIPHQPVYDPLDWSTIDILSNNCTRCFKKMYDQLLSWQRYIEIGRGKWDLIWYKGILFLVPFKTIPVYYSYQPVDIVTEHWSWISRKLVRIKIYKYEDIHDFVFKIKKTFKRKQYIKNDWYMVETLAFTDGSVSARYIRPVKSIDNIEIDTWLFYTQSNNILYIDYEKSFNSDCINDMMNEFPDFTSFDEE